MLILESACHVSNILTTLIKALDSMQSGMYMDKCSITPKLAWVEPPYLIDRDTVLNWPGVVGTL